jgi:hypothetical protein
LQSLCLPASLAVLLDALSGMPSLKSLTFEPGSLLREVETGSLRDCSSLESICVPASVEVLCEKCFYGLTKLSSVTFESGSKLREIKSRVFCQCCSLKSIFLPAAVSEIDGSTFIESSIEEIHVDSENPNFFAPGPFLVEVKEMTLIRYLGRTTNVRIDHFGHLTFTQIGANVFRGESTLVSLCIPAVVEILGETCFSESTSLCELTFESGSRLNTIQDLVFCSCSSLVSICIPAQVEYIPAFCFAMCTSLAELTFERGSKLIELCSGAFSGCFSIRSIIFPSRLEIMGFGSLDECRSLSGLTFEIPSRMRELDLPPSDFGSLCIPDSVEFVTGMIDRLGGQRRLIRFGGESHLSEIDMRKMEPVSGGIGIRRVPGNTVFLCLSEKVLRRFRSTVECYDC